MARNIRQSDAQNVNEWPEKQELEERIQFEKLLCTLSDTFINSPSDAIDKEIEYGLELIVRFLGADRGTVSQFSEDRKTLKVTYSYFIPGGKPLPSKTSTEGQHLLWYTEAIKHEDMVVLESLPDDLPKEALAERQFCVEQGLKSPICIPLSMRKTSPKGAIGFSYMHGRRTWPIQWLERVRKQMEKELQKALTEIKELKKRLEAEIVEEM